MELVIPAGQNLPVIAAAVSACTPVSNHLAHHRADDDHDDHIHDGHFHDDLSSQREFICACTCTPVSNHLAHRADDDHDDDLHTYDDHDNHIHDDHLHDIDEEEDDDMSSQRECICS